MKTEKNILIAFLLNLFFSIFEIIGGIFTNSIAILSDSLHDFLDALSIGISYFLERKSKDGINDIYTYGYSRYSVLGAFITTVMLLTGSCVMIYHSIIRLFNPIRLNYDGMFIVAIIGLVINIFATYFTKDGNSLNEKAVNLHMLEDVFGWIVVLIGSILIKFTNILWIDSVMSILVSIYIFIHALHNLKEVLDLFLLKKPSNIDMNEIKRHILNINGVKGIHHIHLWSMDGINNYATLHVIANLNVKDKIREEMKEHGINHVTIEFETEDEKCEHKNCKVSNVKVHHH